MESEGHHLVVSVDDEHARVIRLSSVVGGGAFSVPLRHLPEECHAEGAVFVGTLLSEGDDWMTDVVRAGSATKQRVKYRRDHWQTGKVTIPFPDAVVAASDRQAAERTEFWVFEPGMSGVNLVGCFTDLQTFLVERRRERAEKDAQHQRGRWHASRTKYDPGSFINPYNFVPLPDVAPTRVQPSGHARRHSELLHGRLDVEFTALSPLLVRDAGDESGQHAGFPRRNGDLVIPGSSVKGALRAVFETITGSCLRVVHNEFTPAYRDILRATNRQGWSLVEVVSVDREGRPTEVRRSTGEPIWFSLNVLQHVLGPDGVKTGATFVLTGNPRFVGQRPNGRLEVRDVEAVAGRGATGREVTLLVTDVGARPQKKGVCFVAAELSGVASAVSVDPNGWRRFEAALLGATDVKRGTALVTNADDTITVDISTSISRGRAYRQVHGVVDNGRGRPRLRAGHVLWAKIDGNTITDLAFAQTWRHGATGPTMGQRVPGFHSCTGSDGLCTACTVFGSANVEGAAGGDGQSYRGHVCFEDWVVKGKTERVQMAPLGLPRPGAGQMYLDHATTSVDRTEAPQKGVPLREWGSVLDSDTPRRLRGRKFYWRVGQAPGRPPRYVEHESQRGDSNKGNLFKDVEVVEAGATVTGCLHFENLTTAQLGALIASLDPAHISKHQHPLRDGEDGMFCLSIGGGKPLGLGALHCSSLELRLEGASERYLGGESPKTTAGEAVADFTGQVSEHVRTTWADLLEMLRWNAVNPAMVSYPRITDWPDQPDRDDPRLFEPGLKWWSRSAGMPEDAVGGNENKEQYSYVTLPKPTDVRVTLPIDIQKQQGGKS